jgi:hypothetical protein
MKKNIKTLSQLANGRNRFAVIVIDETKYWREDIKLKAGKIEAVYLVNLQEPTHLCELSISFPAIQLSNRIKNFEKFTDDELTELENQIEYSCSYFAGNDTPSKLIKLYNYGTEDEIEEYEKCNPTYC